MADRALPADLPARDERMLAELAAGKTPKEVAVALGITYWAVAHALGRLKRERGCATVYELMFQLGASSRSHTGQGET